MKTVFSIQANMTGKFLSAFILVILCNTVHVSASCEDLLGPDNSVSIFDVPTQKYVDVNDCSVVIEKYISECLKKSFKDDGGYCCQSCSNSDLKCIDSTCVTWTLKGQKVLCVTLVEANHQYCNQVAVREHCCSSCEKACYTKKSFKKKITVRVKGKKITCEDCTCKMLSHQDKTFIKKACRKKIVRKSCCPECQKE